MKRDEEMGKVSATEVIIIWHGAAKTRWEVQYDVRSLKVSMLMERGEVKGSPR